MELIFGVLLCLAVQVLSVCLLVVTFRKSIVFNVSKLKDELISILLGGFKNGKM